MTVHAIQPIQPGDEITICYGQPLFAVRSERRDYLQRNMGFTCTCECCSLSGEASQASDMRRTELWRLFKAVPFLGHDAPAGIRA
ncbi:9778_t:CDS:1, partial [Acaulospora colombiana]